ncbi:hypothetical protein E1262_06235 [Jiangella aurantiaca]|uniref:Uncharacterized protein n=1 Tax=Jiangella aurantiaca TaxID=2530373 RepID=A0A4R5AF79_9ACTN|nr:hypothetical protein [Jiangella aurantiaca]TDD71218.1 hypothetical protein E1262_06235 [Jiangella aurantiaca]
MTAERLGVPGIERDLPEFRSSEPDLEEGYGWAVQRALSWVRDDAAIVPSYWAGLTDRPMFYSRDVAHQALGAHLLGLDRENQAMLRHFAESATPARRWYPLWAFHFDGRPAEIDFHSDDDFVREIPAPFELVEKCLEQYRWTGDERYRTDPVLTGFYRAVTTDFVALHDVLGTGVAGEAGTGDIFAGSPTYNEGSAAPGLQVAGDGIASQWAAVSAIRDVLPGSPLAEHAAAEADRLARHFADAWWVEELGRYATGLSSAGPVTAFGYEPSWFPAVKGLAESGPRASAHLDFVSRQLEIAPPPNIEAFTYLPEAYLRYGRDDEALRWIRHLIASRAAYPEVSYTLVAHLLTGLTGLDVAADGTVTTRSHLTGGWVEVAGIPVRDALVSVRHDGGDAATLRVTGPRPVRWIAEVGGGRVEQVVHPGTEAHAAV